MSRAAQFMLYKKIVTCCIVLMTSFLLTGCTFNYHYKPEQMGSVLALPNSFFLRAFRPKVYGFIPLSTRYELWPIGELPSYMPSFGQPASEQAFLAKKDYYQKGYSSFVGEDRIIGIVRANTHYKLLDQYMGSIDSYPYESVEILEGPYRGMKAYLHLNRLFSRE